MKNKLTERTILILKGVRVFFKRLLIILAVIAIGSAMLSIYSFIHFINKMTYIYKGNPNTILIGLILLLIIPLISYALEKSLTSHVNNR